MVGIIELSGGATVPPGVGSNGMESGDKAGEPAAVKEEMVEDFLKVSLKEWDGEELERRRREVVSVNERSEMRLVLVAIEVGEEMNVMREME